MKTKKMILTEKLKTRILDLAKDGRWLDFLLDTDSEQSLVIESWIERGMQEETGIYHEFVKEIIPYWVEAEIRQAERLAAQIVDIFKELPNKEGDIFLASIMIPLLNQRSLVGPYSSAAKEMRLTMAAQIAKAIGPMPHERFTFLKNRLGHILESELRNLQLSAVFEAADILKREKGRDFLPPESYKDMQRLVNNLLSEALLPGWRRKEKGKELELDQPIAKDGDDDSASTLLETLTDPETSPFEQLIENEEARRRKQRLDFLLARIGALSKKTPARVQQIIENHGIEDIKTLSEKLGIERTKLYRELVDPARGSGVQPKTKTPPKA